MVSVAPKRSTPADEAMRARLSDAGDGQRRSTTALRDAVIAAARAGVSVREIAELTQISTNTVQRWKRGGD